MYMQVVELIRCGTGSKSLLVIDMDTEREMAEKVVTHIISLFCRSNKCIHISKNVCIDKPLIANIASVNNYFGLVPRPASTEACGSKNEITNLRDVQHPLPSIIGRHYQQRQCSGDDSEIKHCWNRRHRWT